MSSAMMNHQDAIVRALGRHCAAHTNKMLSKVIYKLTKIVQIYPRRKAIRKE